MLKKSPLPASGRRWPASLFLLAAACLPLAAQTTAPSTPTPAAAAPATDDEIVQLSPFIVDASSDKGYLVGNTLSGSRVRTDLADVAGSVSVMNAEFLKDIGARNMQDALRYEVNSENENEVVYNDTEGTITGDGVSNRVRGLINAQVTRDFFNTYIATDTYNTDRLTISRGPNAILFGIGSPSGSIDANLKRASFSGTSGAVTATFDQYGTRRYELDLNQPLTRWWSVRFDFLNQDKRSFMDPEFDKEKRQFVTTTLRPFARTTITANYEHISNDRVHARRHTAYDGVSAWIAAGKPLYDAFTNTWVNSAGQTVTFNGSRIANSQRNYLFSNSASLPAGAWNGITLATANQALATQGNQAQYSKGSMARSYAGVSSGLLGFNNEALYPSDYNFTGLASRADLSGEIAHVRLEQQITDRLTAELAYNRETYGNLSNEFVRGNFAILQADVNKYLVLHDSAGNLLKDASGSYVKIANPNAGRYMITNTEDIGSGSIGFDRGYVNQSYRATLSYDLDLARRSKWLGRHQFAAMYQRDDSENHILKSRTKNLGDQIVDGLTKSNNNINEVAYVDLPGDSDGTGVHTPTAWTAPADSGYSWWQTITGPLQESAIHNRVVNDARLGVLQSRFDKIFGDDSLVLILGVRRDTQKIYDAPLTANDIDPATGLSKWRDIPLPSEPSQNETGDTNTISAVYHTPWSGLGLTFSHSDNFTPQSKYHDFEGRPQSAMKGKSNEFGVSFDTPNRRFHAKLIRFDAEALNQKEEDWFYWAPAWNAIWYMEYQIKDYVLNIYKPRGEDRSADLVGQLEPWTQSDREVPFRDRRSTGFELEVIAQPIDRLNLRFTASKSDAVDSHIASDMIAYIDRRMPVWEKYADLTASWNRSWSTDAYYDDPRNLYWGDDSAGRKNIYSLGYTPYNDPTGLARVEDLKALEGAHTVRSRATTANLTADYSFVEGPLKHFNIGGGFRYRAPAAIGYLGKLSTNTNLPAGTMVSDLSKPIYGDPIEGVDLWIGYNRRFHAFGRPLDWSINLYAWNINYGRGLQPGEVNFKGEVTRWITREPRTISISNTISF